MSSHVIKANNGKLYELTSKHLGGGALGSVWLGKELISENGELIEGKEVAIKTVDIKPEDDVESVMNEIYVLETLIPCNNLSPYVCYYGYYIPNSNKLYIIMEKVNGIKLSEIDPDDVNMITLFNRAIDGLVSFQEKNLVHRDIKPDNIMVTHNNQLKFVDFGLGCNMKIMKNQIHICKKGNLSGTPGYLDPLFFIYFKQKREYTANHLSDIYALAASFCKVYDIELPSYQDGDPRDVYNALIEKIQKHKKIPDSMKNLLINMMNPEGKRPTAQEIKYNVSNFSEYKDILSALSSSSSSSSSSASSASSSSTESKDNSIITLEKFDQGVKDLIADFLFEEEEEVDTKFYQQLHYDEIKKYKHLTISRDILQAYPYLR